MPGRLHLVPLSATIDTVEEVTRCDFCDLDGFREHSGLVRENDLCLFASGAALGGEFQSLLWGSGIIVPKAHRETVFDLLPDEFIATQELLLEVRPLLDERHEPDGYTIGWNCFAALDSLSRTLISTSCCGTRTNHLQGRGSAGSFDSQRTSDRTPFQGGAAGHVS